MTDAGFDKNWVEAVLRFWFEELEKKDWYMGGDELDQTIIDRFGALHAQLATSPPADAHSNPLTAIAAILVFDQFSRNMFRKTANAFAFDHLALDLAKNAVDKGLDAQMPTTDHRVFTYMPFEHSENIDDQNKCVDLMSALGVEELNKYAIEHRDIIARFGRFPHRNNVLGRQSTPEELAFLSEHSGFGQ